MARIEIRGYLIWHAHQLDEALEIKKRIDAIVQILEMGRDTITEIVPSLAQSCDGNETPRPFVIVWSDDDEERKLVAGRLHEEILDMDIEVAPLLHEFIEGEFPSD